MKSWQCFSTPVFRMELHNSSSFDRPNTPNILNFPLYLAEEPKKKLVVQFKIFIIMLTYYA